MPSNTNNLSTSLHDAADEIPPGDYKKVAAFYFCFNAGLVCFFAICYSVMFASLPGNRSGPKTQFVVGHGVFLSDATVEITYSPDSDTFNENLLKNYEERVARFLNRSVDNDLGKLNVDVSTLGPCSDYATVMAAARNFEYFCVYAKLNRIYGFVPSQDIATSVVLEFPPAERFQSEYEVAFEDFATTYPSTLPASMLPFLNRYPWSDDVATTAQPVPYVDPAFAIVLNTSMVDVAKFSEYNLKLRYGAQFDYGQSLQDEGEGYAKGDYEIRAEL
ncbi:uncharacterized protein MONBRDRAFT_38180 [Monosiga brevicollis MX1]|uniref:Uncharacterized protein n=1 Tax=Monosiga brevicollis TaxID=81824 RepID=A9V655_MONBE|nr:uncharacterized protein MONBRDRAFT_38180 [Monosiga brevicollis MX1]EDQ86931.1 predicted protein [Monosiga brevicollis MX1]|eukprot:XP_001748170.1 hypothetical protein [Monosiga brevicollis MX1]